MINCQKKKNLKRKKILMGISAMLLLSTSCNSGKVNEESFGGVTYSNSFQETISSAKNKVFPAVTYIRGIQENLEYGKKISSTVIGSGFIISETGEVLTNWHVVNKMKNIRCQLKNGKSYNAKLIGSDKDTDMALIQLELAEGERLENVAKIRQNGGVEEGNVVMAMGAPWGLNRSVSSGIISCSSRYLEGSSTYNLWYQTDAAINPGNSGGPLVDDQGRVIGINTLGMRGGLGFAIPAEIILKVIPRIRKYGKVNWAWTGIQLQPLNDFNMDISFDYDDGVIVANVEESSPAKLAGIKPLDRIVKINDEAITAKNIEDIPRINSILGLAPFDEEIALTIVRKEKTMVMKFLPREKGASEGKELELKRWNMTAKTINQFDNQDLYFYRKEGVFIFGVDSPGNAADAGLRDSDIIISIDNVKVKTLDDIDKVYKAKVANVEKSNKLIMTVIRKGLLKQIILDFAQDYDRE